MFVKLPENIEVWRREYENFLRIIINDDDMYSIPNMTAKQFIEHIEKQMHQKSFNNKMDTLVLNK